MYIIKFLINNYDVRVWKGPFPLDFPTETVHTFLSSPMCVACSAQLIILYLMCLTFGDTYRIWSSSLYNFILLLLQLSSFQTLSLYPYSQTPLVYALPFMSEIKFHPLTKQLTIMVLCILTFTFLYLLLLVTFFGCCHANYPKHCINFWSLVIPIWVLIPQIHPPVFTVCTKDV
jgi:hypothetical protein